MKNSYLTVRALCFLLCLLLVFGAFVGCSPKSGTSNSSSKDSSSQTSSEKFLDTSSDDDTEPEDSGDTDDEGTDDDGDFDEDLPDGDTSEEPGVTYERLSVLNSTPICNDFMGFNAVYQMFPYIPDAYGRQYTEAQAKLELDRVAATGVNTIRTYYDSDWAWDKSTNSWNWDSAKMKGFWRCLSELQNRKIDVALASLWYLQRLDSSSYAGITVEGNLDATIKNYSNFMVDTLKQAKARGYNNIKYLIAFTEPNNAHATTTPVWTRNEPKSFEVYAKAVRALDKGLRDAGIRNHYKIVGPNDNIDDTYSYFLDHAVKELNDCIDIYGSHASYAYAGEIIYDAYYDNMITLYPDRLSWVKATKKPFWIDEFNVKSKEGIGPLVTVPWSGTQRAVTYSAAMNLGIQNIFLWTICDQLWPDNLTTNSDGFTNGMQKLGLLPSLFETTIPKAPYYGFAMMCKYTGRGTSYEGATENYGNGLYISCLQRKDGNWTVLVSNAGYFEADIEVVFEKSIGKTLYRHVYDPNTISPTTQARMIPADKIFKNVSTKFYDTIGPGCVAVYTSVKD